MAREEGGQELCFNLSAIKYFMFFCYDFFYLFNLSALRDLCFFVRLDLIGVD